MKKKKEKTKQNGCVGDENLSEVEINKNQSLPKINDNKIITIIDVKFGFEQMHPIELLALN